MKYICIYIAIVEQVSRVKLNWNIPRTNLINLLHTILYSILHFQKLQHWHRLNHLDSTEYENVRITTAVNCLSKTGFNLTIQSWKSTLTYDAWVQWMAFPKWCWLVIHSWCRRTQLYRIIYKGLLLEMYSLIHPHNQERFEETKGVIRRVNHRTVNTMSR